MSSAGPYRELIRFEIDSGTFGSDWVHCGLVSSHLASLVSHKRSDPLYYANLLSSALNELLELAFRIRAGSGTVGCTVLHDGPRDRIVVDIPCDAEGRAFYAEAVAAAQGADIAELYLGCLLDEAEFDPRTGLYELAVDYRAALALEEAPGGAVRLVADLVLDGPQG